MPRYLVTGGAGFIGSNVVDALLGDGHRVTVLDELTSGFSENVAHQADFRYVNGIQGRYFIPCAPFLMFGLYRLRFVRQGRRPIVVFSAIGAAALAMIVAIIRFYYL